MLPLTNNFPKQHSNIIYGNFQGENPKKRPFRMAYFHWDKIRRANDPDKALSEKAQKILSVIVPHIKRAGKVIRDHDYLTKITKCKYSQNNNLLRELEDILNIRFHRTIKIGNKRHYNVFVMTFTPNGEKILENPEGFYTKNHSKKAESNVVVVTKNPESSGKKLSEQSRKIATTNIYNNIYIKIDYIDNRYRYTRAREEKIDQKIIETEKSESKSFESDFNNESSKILPVEQIVPPELVKEPLETPEKNLSETLNFNQNFGLESFYPLTEKDCEILQKSSKRDFSFRAMNEILLDLSKRLQDKSFCNKRSFLAYMSKIFTNEKRSESLLNQEGFKLRNNMSEEERVTDIQEEFLSRIILDGDASFDSVFKKSIADREGFLTESLSRNTAFNLLKAYVSSKIKDNVFILNLRFYVELTDKEREIIMKKMTICFEDKRFCEEFEPKEFVSITSTISNLLNQTTSGLKKITKLIINMPTNMTKTISKIVQPDTGGISMFPDNVWGQIRKDLTLTYNEYKATDQHWISKFTPDINEYTKTITLKTSSKFCFDGVKDHLDKYFRYDYDKNKKGFSTERGWVLHDRGLSLKYPYTIKIAFIPRTGINDDTKEKVSLKYESLKDTKTTTVESNTKVFELVTHITKSIKDKDLILSNCKFTEVEPKKINITVDKKIKFDDSTKETLRQCIRHIYGDDVAIVTKI